MRRSVRLFGLSQANWLHSPFRVSSFITSRRYSGFVSGVTIAETEEKKKEQENEQIEEEGFDPEYKKFSMFGMDKEATAKPNVDVDKIFKRVEVLENHAKLYVKSKGVPIIPAFDRPDSFFYKDLGTRVLTPTVTENYEKQYELNQRIIEGRTQDFKESAFESIEKAIELREKYWGHEHMLTLGAHLTHLSMLEVDEQDQELFDRCSFWLFFCDKTLQKAAKDLKEGVFIDHVSPQIINDALNQEYNILLGFYACVVRITSDCLIRLSKPKEAIELLQFALKEVSKNPKEHLVHIVLLGRCLSNAYVEEGKIEEAITSMQLLLDLQSKPEYAHNINKVLSVDEWIDPTQERINTTIHLTRMKVAIAAYDEAEVLIRGALDIATEHAGKYTSLACQIQFELLNLVKQNPAHSDQEFLDLYQISLDIAKETHKRILKDMQGAHGLVEKQTLAKTLPYTRLLRLGISVYAHSEEHKEFYLRLLGEAVKSWEAELVTDYSQHFCHFAFTAFDELIKYGKYSKATEVLQHMHNAIANTYLDPSPMQAKYSSAQVQVQNLIDFGERAKALPFYDPSLPTEKINPKNKDIVFDLLNDALSSVKRWNNNQIHPIETSPHLYTLASTQALFGLHEEAEKNILRCLALLVPNFVEEVHSICGTPENIEMKALEPLGNVTTLAASLFEQTGQKKRAIKYYQFACRILRLVRCDENTLQADKARIAAFYITQDKILRFRYIVECVGRLIVLHKELMLEEPDVYTEKVLRSYEKHLEKISSDLQTEVDLEAKCVSTFNQLTFKSGSDVLPMLEEMLQGANIPLEDLEKE